MKDTIWPATRLRSKSELADDVRIRGERARPLRIRYRGERCLARESRDNTLL